MFLKIWIMKKTLLIIAAVFGFAVAASAQPKAIGGRIGNYGIDVSYENYVLGNDFLEFEIGLDNGFSTNAFHFDGVYNFMIASPEWTPVGSWGFYAGPGGSVMVRDHEESTNCVFVGAVGNVGLEYTFDFPLSLSVDLRPRVMFGDGTVLVNDIFTLGIGVRYAF